METLDLVNSNIKCYHLSGSGLDAEDTLVNKSDVGPPLRSLENNGH